MKNIWGTQRGMALVSSLLLLVVVTIMAVAMFRSYGLQERIAGNVREKLRALQAAQTAEQYAEWWLSQPGNAASSAPIVCSTLVDAVLGGNQICSPPPSGSNAVSGGFSKVPWTTDGTNGVGTTYVPPFSSITSASLGMNVTTTPTGGSYYYAPRYYITDLGASADGSGEAYQVDAAGFGATTDAAAVVESTFEVGAQSWRADQP